MAHIKISKNFSSREIFPRKSWEDLSPHTRFLARHICNYILQPVRDLKPSVSIRISSGSRNWEDVSRLRSQGYNPSLTTDHYFGQPQTLPVTQTSKIAKYGPIYTYSVGAVDIVPDIPQTEEAFYAYFVWLVKLSETGIIDVGQIILERGKRSYWIHISNPASIVYQAEFIDQIGLQRERYMITLDNGKTYNKYFV